MTGVNSASLSFVDQHGVALAIVIRWVAEPNDE
jgi:hypothetical protein